MIHLTCTSCSATLEVNDAFAGGVCRCKYCGTIQTVPTPATLGQVASGKRGQPKPSVLHDPSDTGRFDGPSFDASGLEDLEAIVTSSGLRSGRMRRPSARRVSEEPARRPAWMLATVAALGLGLAVAAGALLAVSLTGGDAPPTEARLLELTLGTEGTVVYVLDNGRDTAEWGRPLQRALLRSIDTVGDDRAVQVLLAEELSTRAAFPGGPMQADLDRAGRIGRLLDRPPAASASLGPALEEAIEQAGEGGHVVLITGKAWQIDDSFCDEAARLANAAGVHVHCLTLGGDHFDGHFEDLAHATAGQFMAPTESELK